MEVTVSRGGGGLQGVGVCKGGGGYIEWLHVHFGRNDVTAISDCMLTLKLSLLLFLPTAHLQGCYMADIGLRLCFWWLTGHGLQPNEEQCKLGPACNPMSCTQQGSSSSP